MRSLMRSFSNELEKLKKKKNHISSGQMTIKYPPKYLMILTSLVCTARSR